MRFLSRVVLPVLLITTLVSAVRAQVVMTETFKNSTTTDPNWTYAGTNFTPILTSGGADTAGNGWLRLTSTGNSQATSAYFNSAFTAANATVYASFDYVSWGGTGADGLVFFLYDGSKTFGVGADGGSIGYAQKTGVNGMNGGYLGVAVDEFGNFSNGTEGRSGGIGFTPDAFAVRGPGTGTTGYDYLGGTTSLSTSIDTPSVGTRPTQQNTIQLLLSPTNQLTVTLQQGGTSAQTVLSMDLSGYARPDTLKFGFSSGTGGSTNYHEVRNLNVTTLVANLWDGGAGDGLWGTANNWNPNIVPSAGADILLDNTYVSSAQTINTGTDRTVRSLQIDAPFGYTVNNNTLTFDSGIIPSFSGIAVTQTRGAADHTINSALVLNTDIGIRQNSTGALTLNGNISLGGHAVAFDGTGNTTVTGIVSGTGAVTKSQAGTVFLNAANTYSGGTTVSGGTLSTNNNAGFGTGAITLSGGTIASSAANTINNIVTLSGNGGINGLTVSNTITQSGGDRTLILGNSTLSGAVNLSESNTGRTLTTQVDAGTSTISGIIGNGGTGAGSLTKTGAGELVLSGANTYTGTTTITSGTLSLGASGVLADTAALNISSSGTLNLNGLYSEKVGNLTAAGGATIDFGTPGTANNFVFGNYTAPASGVLVINNYESGVDKLATTQAGIATGTLNTIYISGIGPVTSEAGSTSTIGTLGSAYLLTATPATGVVWAGTGNQWNTGTNWVGGSRPGTTQVAVFNSVGTAQLTSNFGTSRTVAGILFDTTAPGYTVAAAGGTLTLAGAVPFIQQKSSANQIVNPPITLSASTVMDITGSGNLTLGGAITSTSSLIRDGNGSGRLILSGANTGLTGQVYINTGIVQAQNTSALGTNTVNIANGGALELSGTISPANAVSVAGSGVGGLGAINSVSGSNTLSGAIALTADTTFGAATGATLNLTNTASGITGAGKNITFAPVGTGAINVSEIATGTGTVTVGGGNVTFNGTTNANTYTGLTTVNSGNLTLSKNAGVNAIAGNVTVNGGSLILGSSNQIADTATVLLAGSGVFNLNGQTESVAALQGSSGASVSLGAGTLSLTGSSQTAYDGTFSGSGTLNKSGTGKIAFIGGSSGLSGPVNLSGGIINVSGSASNILGTGAVSVSGTGNLEMQGGATLANAMTLNSNGTGANDGAIQNVAGNNTLSGAVTLAGNSRVQSDAGLLTFSNTVALGANTLNVGGIGNTTLAGAVSGTGGLTKDGSGTLTLSGANTFAGNITVSAGTLQLGASNTVPNTASVSVATGSTLDLNGNTDTFAGFSGSGTLLMNGGNLTLTGSNIFNGGISGAGTLSVTNSLSLGAVLNDPGLTINLAGTLNLGAFVNTAGTLNLTGNSILDFGGAGASEFNLSNLNLNGYTLTITNWANNADYFFAQNWSGATLNSRGSAPMNQITFNGYSNNYTAWQPYDTKREITPAPEPSTYGAIFIALSVAGVGFRRWQSRKRATV